MQLNERRKVNMNISQQPQVRILVDSTFNLYEDFIKKNNIKVVPLNVIIDGQNFHDGVDINIDTIMEKLNEGKKVSTSQPTPGDYLRTFEELKAEGATDILCLTISSTLSGTYNAAVLSAGEAEGVNVHVIDTYSAAMGADIVARIIDKDLNKGKTIAEIEDKIRKLRSKSGILLSMENLNAMNLSGHISKVAATIGNLLHVKPVLEYINGKVSVIAKRRTERAVIDFIVDRLSEHLSNITDKVYIFLSHIRANDTIIQLKKAIESRFDKAIIMISKTITPVIAVNIGYGGFGVAWCIEN
jgi:DegV family protein with EDD domain